MNKFKVAALVVSICVILLWATSTKNKDRTVLDGIESARLVAGRAAIPKDKELQAIQNATYTQQQEFIEKYSPFIDRELFKDYGILRINKSALTGRERANASPDSAPPNTGKGLFETIFLNLFREGGNLKDNKATDADQEQSSKARTAAEQALQDKLRLEQIARLTALSGTQTTETNGRAPFDYGSRIVKAIKPNLIFTEQFSGNPLAEVEVTVAPDGLILGRKLVRSSGNVDWDSAVLRAVDRAVRLPRDANGTAPSPMVLSFRPNE